MELSLTAPFAGACASCSSRPTSRSARTRPCCASTRWTVPYEPARGERVGFRSSPAAGDLQRLEWLLLGYDVPDDEVERMLTADLGAGEHRLLRLYADLCALARPRRDADDGEMARGAAGVPARVPALARRARGAAAASTSSRCSSARSPTTASSASIARPPWRTPATGSSSPSSARSPRARSCSRSSTGGSRRRRPRPDCARCSTPSSPPPRAATPPWPSARASCVTRPSTRPLAAAARERDVRRDERAPRRARRATRTGPIAMRGSARSSLAHACWRRC